MRFRSLAALVVIGATSCSFVAQSSNSAYPNGISPTWLQQMDAQWRQAAAWPLILSPLLSEGSYDHPVSSVVTQAVLDADLAMLEQSGARAITVDIGYDPWLDQNPALDRATIAKDDQLIARIRGDGRLVVLKDAAAEAYRHNQLSWDQFQAAWIERVRTIAGRYHPDYYTLVKEPPWYAPMIAGLSRSNLSNSADQQVNNVAIWTALLTELIQTVKSASPQTKVGIAADGNLFGPSTGDRFDLGFFQAALRLPELDFLGFDLYTSSAFTDTEQFLNRFGSGGKAVWINEAWSQTTTGAVNAEQPQLDAQWAKALMDFARSIQAQGVSPFYTDRFASYASPPDSAQGWLQFFGGRTPVFYAFQEYEAGTA